MMLALSIALWILAALGVWNFFRLIVGIATTTHEEGDYRVDVDPAGAVLAVGTMMIVTTIQVLAALAIGTLA